MIFRQVDLPLAVWPTAIGAGQEPGTKKNSIFCYLKSIEVWSLNHRSTEHKFPSFASYQWKTGSNVQKLSIL